jgi:hypothetical protein
VPENRVLHLKRRDSRTPSKHAQQPPHHQVHEEEEHQPIVRIARCARANQSFRALHARAVLRVAIEGEPNSITYEDIGRLVVWADHVADLARDTASEAAKVSVAARESFSLPKGYPSDLSSIFNDEYGGIVDREVFESVNRRFVNA